MELTGHELEMKYTVYITQLRRAKSKPHWSDVLWVGKKKKRLKARLEKLEQSHLTGYVGDEAYAIWAKMINEVL